MKESTIQTSCKCQRDILVSQWTHPNKEFSRPDKGHTNFDLRAIEWQEASYQTLLAHGLKQLIVTKWW